MSSLFEYSHRSKLHGMAGQKKERAKNEEVRWSSKNAQFDLWVFRASLLSDVHPNKGGEDHGNWLRWVAEWREKNLTGQPVSFSNPA